MGRRFWIIIGFLGFAAISASAVLFLVLRFTPPKAGPEEAFFPESELEKIAGYKKSPIPGVLVQTAPTTQWLFPAFKEPESPFSAEGGSASGGKPFFQQEEEKFSETFLKRFSSLTKLPEILSLFPVTTPPASEEESKASSTPKKTLTDEEWFKIAYPKPVLDALPVIEEAMRFTGFISQSEKFEFTSDEKIRAFWHKAIEWALKENMIDEKQVKGFRDGIDIVIPQLQKEERRQYEQNLSAYLLKLIFAKLTKTAFALGECYREGSGMGSGSNSWAMCCNCGFYYDGEDYIWYDDCDYGYCNFDLGCKNLMCESGAMIWDSASGICGCG